MREPLPIPRALSLATLIESLAEEPRAPRLSSAGLPCGLCGNLVPYARRTPTTIPVCEDCLREAELRGRYICRDVAHPGDRLVGYRSMARVHHGTSAFTCMRCHARRRPGSKARRFESDPCREDHEQAAPLRGLGSSFSLLESWQRCS